MAFGSFKHCIVGTALFRWFICAGFTEQKFEQKTAQKRNHERYNSPNQVLLSIVADIVYRLSFSKYHCRSR